MRAAFGLLLVAAFLSQDVEAKKARAGEILKAVAKAKNEAGGDKAKEAEAQQKWMPELKELSRLIQEVAGPDREKQGSLFQELMEKYIPEEAAAERVASNERNASVTLMWIGTAQAQFRADDPDADGVANYWVKDISGLHRLRLKTGKSVALVDDKIARADARPAWPLEAEGTPPKAEGIYFLRTGSSEPHGGYFFAAVPRYQSFDGSTIPYDSGNGRNATKYGLCAFPAEYGKTGKMTFIKNEASSPPLWKKDTAGQAVPVFPADPTKEGWLPVE